MCSRGVLCSRDSGGCPSLSFGFRFWRIGGGEVGVGWGGGDFVIREREREEIEEWWNLSVIEVREAVE